MGRRHVSAGPQRLRNGGGSTRDEQTHTGPKRREDTGMSTQTNHGTPDVAGVFSRPPNACWGPIGCYFGLGSTQECAHALQACSGFKRPSHRKCQGNGRSYGRFHNGSKVLAGPCWARHLGPRASKGRPEVHPKPQQPPRSSCGAWGHTPLVALVVREGHPGNAAWTRRFRK